MGNWRTVNIKGRMDATEAKDAIEFLKKVAREYCDEPVDCFAIGNSLCGLNQWIQDDGTIDAIGNLFERDFDNDDIEEALKCLAEKYPSMELTLHSGSDWESLVCSATFHVKDGEVERCEPEIKELHKISEAMMRGRFFEQIYGKMR